MSSIKSEFALLSAATSSVVEKIPPQPEAELMVPSRLK